jgi:hypothetical protein
LDNLANEGEQGFEKTNRLAGLSQREEYSVPSSNDRTKSRKQKGLQNELLNSISKSKGSIPFSLVGKGSGAAQATTKSARAHAKSYTSGPPLVPAIIVTKLFQYVQRVKLRRMREYVEKICRYWSLKREARRGAPLLKRLYLEVCFEARGCSHVFECTHSLSQFSHGPRRTNRKNKQTQRRLEDWRWV